METHRSTRSLSAHGKASTRRVVGDGTVVIDSPELVLVVDVAVDDGDVRRAAEIRPSRRRATVLCDLEKPRLSDAVQCDDCGQVTDSRVA